MAGPGYSGPVTNARGEAVHTLALADFEAHDPTAPARSSNRRFLCPLPPCAGHQTTPGGRSVSFNVPTGLWNCKRCKAAGQDPAQWKHPPGERSGVGQRERQRDHTRRALSRAFGPSSADIPADTPVSAAPAPSEASTVPPPAAPEAAVWTTRWGTLQPLAGTPALAGTPGAEYLEGRGLPAAFCHAAGVRFAPDFYRNPDHARRPGWPAVVFPGRNEAGVLTAVQGRRIGSNQRIPKVLTLGRITPHNGVYATPGALDPGALLVVVEAPIDALSLARCGVPAVATFGTQGLPAWLRTRCALRPVLAAYDNDPAGDEAALKLAAAVSPNGATLFRLRPPHPFKDWNEALVKLGQAELSAILAADKATVQAALYPASLSPSPPAIDSALEGDPPPHSDTDAPLEAEAEPPDLTAILLDDPLTGFSSEDYNRAIRQAVAAAESGAMPAAPSDPPLLTGGHTAINPRKALRFAAHSCRQLAARHGDHWQETLDGRIHWGNIETLARWWWDRTEGAGGFVDTETATDTMPPAP